MVILYSNERVIKNGNNYCARIINFTDFLVLLSKQSDDYRLALSCDAENREGIDASRLTPVDCVSGQVLELPYLRNRYQSFINSLRLALQIRRYVRSQPTTPPELGVVSPGLNSITFVLSFLLPRRTRWYFFIRGDTRNTVDEIYRRSPLRRLMTAVIDLFQWRLRALLRQGRGRSFVFGEALQQKFYRDFPARTHVVSPLLSQDWIAEPSGSPERSTPSDRGPRVFFVGRLSAEKNIAQLIEACAQARGSKRQFELTIVGDGPLEAELKSRVDTLGIASRIDFTGRVSNGPDLIRLYDAHDVFCLPSKTEGTPRAIAESVARGLPVVASDVGSVRHMFSQGTVQLLDGFTASDILKALGEVFEHIDERRELARQRRGEAERHTLDYNVNNVHRIIQWDRGETIGD